MGCKGILLAMSVVFISACSSKSSDTIDVDSDDEEMNAAITKANYTFNQFKDVLVSGDTSIRLISIKLSVETDGAAQNISGLVTSKLNLILCMVM